MAKLSEAILEEGRTLLRAHDFDGFRHWVSVQTPALDAEQLCKTMERLVVFGNEQRAMKVFEATFPDHDPAVEKTRRAIGVGCAILWAILATACTVGALYLLHALLHRLG